MNGARQFLPLLALGVLGFGCDGAEPNTPAAADSKAAEVAVAVAEPGPRDAEPAPAEGEEPPYDGPPKRVLVELFTSQGCNSCPAADAFIGELEGLGLDRSKVIPLTFHVTYWDDLGWQDPYARQVFDQRQISYAQLLPAAKAAEETTIKGPYTPQMIVDGKLHFSGTMKEVAKAEIERAQKAPTPIAFEASTKSAEAGVRSLAVKSRVAEAVSAEHLDTNRSKVGIFAALVQHEVKTEVPRGENAGKTLDEYWVVRDFQGPKLFRSSRENETGFDLQIPEGVEAGELDTVVFFQDLGTLQILATGVAEKG